jgi:hypothetical protein
MLAVDAAHERVREVGWVLDYVADLEADFCALYRVDDMLALPGPRFLRLAQRTPAYAGVMAARAEGIRRAEEDQPTPARPAREVPAPRDGPHGPRVVPSTRAALAADPVFGDLIEMGGARRG